MSIALWEKLHSVFASLVAVFVCCVLAGPLAAQAAEPDYQFEFIARNINSGAGEQTGILQVSVLPPQLHQNDRSNEAAQPAILRLEAEVYSGQWLAGSGSNQPASEQERLVLGKFELFQTAEQAEQYQRWLDPETYSTFLESIARNEIDLASDRELYLQYDNIRLLASIRYGVYTLLYTQFRTAGSEELTASVMPARVVGDRLVTAGSLHANSHELYRMLVFGTLQRQLMGFLEKRVNN